MRANTITDDKIRWLQDNIPANWSEPRRDALIDACESALGFGVTGMPSVGDARHQCTAAWNIITGGML